MSLSDSQLERYARQVIIPGVGVAGQERLLASRVLILGDSNERAVAADYLTRAGATLADSSNESVDCVVACRVELLSNGELSAAAAAGAPFVWYSLQGRRLIAGILSPFDGRRPIESSNGEGDDAALGSLAACDAAALALSVLLGWSKESSARWETVLA